MTLAWIGLTLGRCSSSDWQDKPLDSLLRITTVEQLKKTFGDSSVTHGPEGAVVLFRGSQQEVSFGLDPYSHHFIFVKVDDQPLLNIKTVKGMPARWKTASGMYPGMSLDDIQVLNGKPFGLTKDQKGLRANDWNEGALAGERALVTFSVVASKGPAIAVPASSEDFISRGWKLRVQSITLTNMIPTVLTDDTLPDLSYPRLDFTPQDEFDTLAARQAFWQALKRLPAVTYPIDLTNARNNGIEVDCRGFPNESFCLMPYSDQTMNTNHALLPDTSRYYAVLWSGYGFAYFANIKKLQVSTFDKNWKPIATADLHIWLPGWKYAQGTCRETGEPDYRATMNSDQSFSLSYSCVIDCAEGDDAQKPFTDHASISGQISNEGKISVRREGFDK